MGEKKKYDKNGADEPNEDIPPSVSVRQYRMNHGPWRSYPLTIVASDDNNITHRFSLFKIMHARQQNSTVQPMMVGISRCEKRHYTRDGGPPPQWIVFQFFAHGQEMGSRCAYHYKQ